MIADGDIAQNLGPGTQQNAIADLRVAVATLGRAAIASIDVVSTARPDLPALSLRAGFAQAELTPINLRGEATRSSAFSTWPLRPAGPTAVAIYFDRQSHRLPLPATLLILRDATGAPLALARLRP